MLQRHGITPHVVMMLIGLMLMLLMVRMISIGSRGLQLRGRGRRASTIVRIAVAIKVRRRASIHASIAVLIMRRLLLLHLQLLLLLHLLMWDCRVRMILIHGDLGPGLQGQGRHWDPSRQRGSRNTKIAMAGNLRTPVLLLRQTKGRLFLQVLHCDSFGLISTRISLAPLGGLLTARFVASFRRHGGGIVLVVGMMMMMMMMSGIVARRIGIAATAGRHGSDSRRRPIRHGPVNQTTIFGLVLLAL
mmetsp:Transcript_13344/g.29376  ORF Transcript_13344/g.29376 Transcript_13344/m.29376 type:complete len:246 (-) Transcript_13344:75-812(-)